MTFYEKSAASAQKMLKKYGQAGAIERKGQGTPTKPWESGSESVTSHAVTCVVTGYAASLIDGSAIKAGDKQVIIAARGLGIVPETTDIVVLANERYSIVSVEIVSPAGIPIIYKVQARR